MLPVLGSRANAHARHRLSPREMLTGIKTSFTRDLRIGFLDYAQLTEPVNETPYNSPKPRTRGGVALYSLGNSKGSVTFMALDTGAEVAREKFHLPPMSDVVVSHLNALAAKDKKTISKEPAFLYHGLVIPDDTPTSDLDDTHFSPLPTEASHPTTDQSSHPPDDHDSSNYGGEQTETEEPHKIEPLKENQQIVKTGGAPTITEEMGGDPTSEINNDYFEEIKDMALKEIKTVKTVRPKDKFV